MSVGDELSLIAVEEGQQQQSNVRAVDISVSHDDDGVVAEGLEVELDPCEDTEKEKKIV